MLRRPIETTRLTGLLSGLRVNQELTLLVLLEQEYASAKPQNRLLVGRIARRTTLVCATDPDRAGLRSVSDVESALESERIETRSVAPQGAAVVGYLENTPTA